MEILRSGTFLIAAPGKTTAGLKSMISGVVIAPRWKGCCDGKALDSQKGCSYTLGVELYTLEKNW